jgi:ribosome-associated protein
MNGLDIKVYDVHEVSNVTDTFIICSSHNSRHTRALCDKLVEYLKENGIKLVGKEGLDDGHWALVDCADFVVHIFVPESREFYDLELIWGDAPLIDWEDHGSD